MTLVLELPPAMEEGLRTEAERQGISAETLALDVLGTRFGPLDAEARIARLSAAIASLPRCDAPLPDEAIGRAAFYRE